MAQSDNSGLIKFGVLAGVGWYAYNKGWLSFLGLGTGTGTPTGTPPAGGAATPPVTPPPAPVTTPPSAGPPPPSLSALYTQLVNAAGPAQAAQLASGGQRFGPDDFNAILVGIYPAAGPLPDPNQLFGDTGWSRPAAMPIASYWAKTSAWLQQNKGLAGVNGYAGLGALAARQRGWA
jgi:hypothetical protein